MRVLLVPVILPAARTRGQNSCCLINPRPEVVPQITHLPSPTFTPPRVGCEPRADEPLRHCLQGHLNAASWCCRDDGLPKGCSIGGTGPRQKTLTISYFRWDCPVRRNLCVRFYGDLYNLYNLYNQQTEPSQLGSVR